MHDIGDACISGSLGDSARTESIQRFKILTPALVQNGDEIDNSF